MKNTLKIVSLTVALAATLSGSAALAANVPAKPVGTNCDAFASVYKIVSAGSQITNGAVIYAAASLVDQFHTLQNAKLITLKSGDLGTLDGFINVNHKPSDGWQYVYNCKPENGVATITFDVTNPAFKGTRHTAPVSFEVTPKPAK